MADPAALYRSLYAAADVEGKSFADIENEAIRALYAHARKEGMREAAGICDRMTDKSVRGRTRGATGQVVGLYEADATACRDAILAALEAK